MTGPALLDDLRSLLGERVTTAVYVRADHGKDIVSSYPDAPPDVVVFPYTTAEVRDVVDVCRRHRTPMIPFGAGTAVEGHVLAVQGGVCVDLSRMNAILAVHREDLDCTVQAGVTREQLNEHLAASGLFFPVDPGANAVRYGTMRENVLALTVVTADGRVITTSRRARKSAAGYDLTRLFVGAEGTLGIITEVTVRLYPIPKAIGAAVCSFADLDGAVTTVIETLQAGIPIARGEALCGLTMRAINAHSGTAYKEQPTLFLEFHGTDAGVAEQAAAVQAIARANGGEDFAWAADRAGRDRLWEARHEAFFAAVALRPGARTVTADVCVPISRLAECMVATEADIASASMPIPIFGHVGDGNFHCVILVDPDDAAELAEAREFNTRLVDRALAMDGTCTGEHGIGIGKLISLEKELGEAVDVMRAIKRALDPDNLLNPGKVLTETDRQAGGQ
jgi:D-lactate dehydrogenase (cytochrome)